MKPSGSRAVLRCLGAGGMLLGLVAPLQAQDAGVPRDGGGEDGAVDSGRSDAAAPTADEGFVPPSLLEDATPTYPERAKAEGVSATVTLELDLDVQGKVEQARVKEPAEPVGYGFDEAALEAAYRLKFRAARENGVGIPVRINYRFRFVPDIRPEVSEKAEAEEEKAAEVKGPTGELRGALQERGTRIDLSGVKVTVFRGEGEGAEGYETDTDESGEFVFTELGVGEWRVLADPEGYYPLRTTEEVRDGERTDVRYLIEKQSYNPYDVTVETDRVKREVNRTVIDAKRAERIPGTFGDVLAVVNNFPGVARTNFNQLVVRGSAPEDSRRFVNGIEVPLLFHFGGLRSVLPSGVIDRIEFYPGNFSVEYGRATGGIVDVGLKTLNPKQLDGYLDISVLDASLWLEAPITDELSIAVGGRRSYIDAILEAALPQDSFELVAPRYYDFQLLASYQPSAEHRVNGLFFFSDDEFRVLFDEPAVFDPEFVVEDIGFGTTFYRGIVEYQFVPNKDVQNELKISIGNDTVGLNVGTGIFFNVDLLQAQVRDTTVFRLNEFFRVRTGLDYLFQNVTGDIRSPTPPSEGQPDDDQGLQDGNLLFTSFDEDLHATGLFAEFEIRPLEPLLIVPGVRFDHYSRTDEFGLSPRLTARYQLAEQWAVKGGVGLFSQEPVYYETDPVFGNPDLGLEKAIHYSAGFEYTPVKYVNIDVTGFYKDMFDLVSPTVATTSQGDEVRPLRYSNEGEGRVYGVEVSAKHELSDGFYGWVAYTLSRSERLDAESDEYRLFDFDQTHILTLIGAYQLPENWEISARWRYVSGNPETPVVGATYDSRGDRYRRVNGPVNSARVDAFHQLDIRIDKRWVFGSWMLNVYLDIQNVYNRQNAEGADYNYDFTKKESTTGLPILPVLGIRGEI